MYVLGIDFGGGASKATLIDEKGQICAQATAEYPTLHPEGGASEQRSEDWITALCRNTRSILETSGIAPGEIAAVAVDSATHSSLLCDASFQALRPALHWTDARSAKEAARLRAERGEEIFQKTFHYPDPIWTLPQLMYLAEREPEVLARARYLFFEKDYIRFFLTGVFMTDRIEAAGSMFYDCAKGDWDDALLSLAGLRRDMMPPLADPCDPAGSVTAEASRATGLAAGTPVYCGTTDTALEIFAAGAVEKGDMTVKLATAGRICVVTDKPAPDRHLVTYPHVVKGLWYPGTATKAAASSFRWFRDAFGGDYKALDEEAAKLPAGSEGLLFHPYLAGELTPYGDPDLKGSFTGVQMRHTKAHFARAVLEGVAFSLMDCLMYLEGLDLPHKNSAILIGGGAKSPLWRRILCDALGIELKVAASGDSSLGSAMLAGVAAGIFPDEKAAVASCSRITATLTPNGEEHARYEAVFKQYKAIHDALAATYRGEKA